MAKEVKQIPYELQKRYWDIMLRAMKQSIEDSIDGIRFGKSQYKEAMKLRGLSLFEEMWSSLRQKEELDEITAEVVYMSAYISTWKMPTDLWVSIVSSTNLDIMKEEEAMQEEIG